MKKILFMSNIARRIGSFSLASIKVSQDCGLEFHSAANWTTVKPEDILEDEKKYGIKIHNIDLARFPLSLKNINAYKQVVELIKREGFDYIHCNTPVGGLLGRLAGQKCKVKKVIYQAHGFHFYKGARLFNWLIYYPIEKWLAARYTDAIITINQEDYELAQKKFKPRNNGKVYYVPGVGIDPAAYAPDADARAEKRKELNLSDHDFALVSAGRFDKNKNNATLIRALAKVNCENVKLLFCGDGVEHEMLNALVQELGLTHRVQFLGNRSDMREIYQAADALVLASHREGLSRTIMESMASGLPCIVSKIRGNVDLIEEGKGGYLCAPTDVDAFANAIVAIAENKAVASQMQAFNLEKIKEFDAAVVEDEIKKIYSSVL